MGPALKAESCRGRKALIESGNDKRQQHAVPVKHRDVLCLLRKL